MITEAGELVEFSLVAGSEADVRVFKDLHLDLPEGSMICVDKAYTDYHYEGLLGEAAGLHLKAQGKKNSNGRCLCERSFWASLCIETVSGGMTNLFSKKIHVLTPRGFELKIVCFLLAFSIQCL